MKLLNVLYRPLLSILLLVMAGGIASYAALSEPSSEAQFNHVVCTAIYALVATPIETIDFIVYWGTSWLFNSWYLTFLIAFLSLGFLAQKPLIRIAGTVAVILFGLAILQFALGNAFYGASTKKIAFLEIIAIMMFALTFTGVYAFAITRFSPKSKSG